MVHFRSAVTGLLLVASPLAQTSSDFARVEESWPQAVRTVTEPGGSILEAQGDRCVRRRGAETVTLACTDPAGTGTIHALALHPYGGVFVAADHGVYLTDAAHDVLDAPDQRDGFPPGRPLGLHVDGRGRLWLATEQAFGVVDTRQFFGRTFSAADGLPAPPLRGFAVAADGRFLLRNDEGVFAYTPDRGEAPRGVVLDGDTIEGAADGAAPLRLEGSALGGATFRYRRHHHHLLYPLEPPVVRGLKPGTHAVDVLVFDRDLNARLAATVDVRIPFPRTLDKRTLLPLAALAGLLVLAFFVLRGRRQGGGHAAYARALLSTVLCGVLSLQLAAGVLGYGRSWPFVGFSMYTETYHEGSVLFRPRLIGLWPDGRSREVQLYEAGLAQDGYWQLFGEMVYGDDSDRVRLLDAWDAHHPDDPLRGFEIQDDRTRLTADGPVRVAPIVMVRYER